jgi:tetratricopeptide (TPR) repeat protein
MLDNFQTDVSMSGGDTLSAWHAAMADYLNFSGTPVGDLEAVNDNAFLLGPVFCAAMKLLSGMDPAGASVGKNIAAMRKALTRVPGAERGHAAAVEQMLLGNFSAAAHTWDTVLVDRPGDILAHKCSHEAWFLVGDAPAMLESTSAALSRIDTDHPAFAVAAAQHGFALEENGDYAAAESWGRLALEIAPSDCWALHCLAHVYETQNRHSDAMALLDAKKPFWSEQNLLNAHIWWHLALRQIEIGDFASALSVFDAHLSDVAASNRFRLTDGTSLLWRLELAGVDVGARWMMMAEKWAQNVTLHTNAFLDMHAALAFSRCPDVPASQVFFDSLDTAFEGSADENAETFHTVVKPLVRAFSRYSTNPLAASSEIEVLLPDLHRLGGSIVQREIVERSYSSALLATGQYAKSERWLAPKLAQHPNTPWVLRDAAQAAMQRGDTANSTLLLRRADLMFGSF